MNIILKIILIIILTPIIGCLFAGIDRKLTARLQHRVGPPLLQPFYDFLKLMSKENIVANKNQNTYILVYFMFVIASVLMLFLEMDLLMIIFVYTIANVSLIIGGMSSGSPYAKIGSHREMMSMLSYEPVLIFFIIGMYMLTGSFNIDSLNSATKPLIVYLPLIFISMLFIMSVKFKKSPFDFSTSHHAHQELVKGIFTEFSGPAMGLVELTHWYDYVFLSGLMFMFWKQNIVMGLVISIFTFLFVIVLDNITARLTWQWLFKVTWTIVIGLSIINILIVYFMHLTII
jgi:ech hydrogenase subunit B